jgi:hypothetical protein
VLICADATIIYFTRHHRDGSLLKINYFVIIKNFFKKPADFFSLLCLVKRQREPSPLRIVAGAADIHQDPHA